MMIKFIKSLFGKRKRVIRVNGQSIEITPLNIKEFFELLVILSPYIALVEDKWVEISKLLKYNNHDTLISNFIRTFQSELKEFPNETIKILSILLKKDEQWILDNVSPSDMIRLFRVIDRVNKFNYLKYYLYTFNKVKMSK